MASNVTRPVEGFTRLAGPSRSPSTRALPAGVILQDKSGYDWYFWPTTAGVLRYAEASAAEAAGFNWETGGTAV